MASNKKAEENMNRRMRSLQKAATASNRFQQEIREDMDPSAMSEAQLDRVRYIADEYLVDDPDNDVIYGEDPDEELVEAMRTYGFQGVILAYPIGEGRYMIEAGHRRRVAAKKAGIKKHRVYVTNPPKSEADRRMRLLMSNLHSRKLSPMRIAKIAQSLYDTHRMIIEEKRENGTLEDGETTALNVLVAADMEMNDSTVERYRALLKLTPGLQEMADSGLYSWSDLSKAAPLDDGRQNILCERIADRAKKYGPDSVTRKWLQSEITYLKQDKAEKNLSANNVKPEQKKKNVTVRVLLRNIESMNEMLDSDSTIKKNEIRYVMDALEDMKTKIEEKLEKMKNLREEK